jgi:hydroxyacylglutathione hydrolase
MTWLHQHKGIDVLQFPCLSDNYGFLVHDHETGECTAIDTPDADAINQALATQNWSLTQIWNTHWHPDHTGGNDALKKKWNCQITGPVAENGRIPVMDLGVEDGAHVTLGATKAQVLHTPGHTTGHIVYILQEAGVAFVGDTLFALGCGRLFEGTAEQMWTSLLKLRALPDDTTVYCAHEYTEANAAFAITADPENDALAARHSAIKMARTKNEPTVPTTIGIEKETNPFLRADAASVINTMGLGDVSAADVFAEVRRRKDNF